MTQLVFLIVIFQVFCFYHIYSRGYEFYWYVIILLFPLLGGLAYFIYHFYNRSNMQVVSETASSNFTQEIDQEELADELDLTDTVSNKIRLADSFMDNGKYDKAIELYKSCMTNLYEDDEELNNKLLQAYYSSGDYLSTITLGRNLEKKKYFQNSEEKIAYAWSYFELHDDEKAAKVFDEMNIPHTNYQHRKEYAKFLIEIGEKEKADTILAQLLEEFSDMDEFEKKIKSSDFVEIRQIKSKLT